MSGMRAFVIFIAALLAVPPGLAGDMPGKSNAATLVQVRRGVSSGECGIECWDLIEISRNKGHYSEGTFNTKVRALAFDINLSPSQWQELEAIALRAPIRKTNETIGCPDCGDGGAEWIELVYSDGSRKKVTIDQSHRPPALKEIAEKLDRIAATYRARQPRRATDAVFDPIKLHHN